MRRGESTKVSNDRILLEILINPGPGMYASEVAERIDITRVAVDARLKELEDEGLVNRKRASNRNLWWLTPRGGEQVWDAAHEAVEMWAQD